MFDPQNWEPGVLYSLPGFAVGFQWDFEQVPASVVTHVKQGY